MQHKMIWISIPELHRETFFIDLQSFCQLNEEVIRNLLRQSLSEKATSLIDFRCDQMTYS